MQANNNNYRFAITTKNELLTFLKRIETIRVKEVKVAKVFDYEI